MFGFILPLIACCDFLIQAQDGTFINGRSLEFGVDLGGEFVFHPRGETITSSAPNGKQGLSWTSRYGYLSIISLGQDHPIDGLNETGLSFGALWLPESHYPPITDTDSALAIEDLGAWILGNFQSVNEIKEALPDVEIWGQIYPELGMIPPLHIAIHDASGSSIVIEFLDEEVFVFDNPLSVLTNSPPFPFHFQNVRNFLNLSPQDPLPLTSGDVTYDPVGHGGGMRGLPGDWSPPSRFIKLFYMMHYATPAQTGSEAINLAVHYLNTVDIPKGLVRTPEGNDYTQWVVIKDLTHRKLLYRTYQNQTFQEIDLKSFSLSKGAPPTRRPLFR